MVQLVHTGFQVNWFYTLTRPVPQAGFGSDQPVWSSSDNTDENTIVTVPNFNNDTYFEAIVLLEKMQWFSLTQLIIT